MELGDLLSWSGRTGPIAQAMLDLMPHARNSAGVAANGGALRGTLVHAALGTEVDWVGADTLVPLYLGLGFRLDNPPILLTTKT